MRDTWRDEPDAEAPTGEPKPPRPGAKASESAAPGEASAGGEAATPSEGDPRYVFGSILGEGGMGRVYQAHDHQLRRDVAIKVLKGGGVVAVDRFLAEAQVTAQLQHPNIPPVHEVGRLADGRPYFAMKQVRGESLDVWMQRGPSMEERVDVVRRVCDAMAFAHDRGVIHRDLKPANVMVGAFGEVVVMDWGLARPIGAAAGEALDVERFERSELRTRDGNVAGTPAFMAPEQAAGRLAELDARSDVYAIGAVLYQLVSGVLPYEGEPDTVLAAVRAGKLVGPRARTPSVPRELDAVVRKAMAARPDDRYPSALALRADLDAWIGRRPLVYVRSSLGERLGKWAARHRGAVRTAGAVGAAAAVALLLGAWRYSVDVGLARDAAVSEAERARTAEVDARQALGRARLALADALSSQSRFGEARAALDAAQALEPTGTDARAVALAQAVLAADSPAPLSTCRPHGDNRLRAVAAAPDATRLASWGEDGRLALWDPLDCAVAAETQLAGAPGMGALAVGAEGAWAAVLAGDRLHVGRVGVADLAEAIVPAPLAALGIDDHGAGWAVTLAGDGYAFGPDAVLRPDGGPQPDGGLWVPDGRLRVGNSLRTGGELGGAWSAATQAPLWTAPTVAWADADAAGERLLVGDSHGVRLIRLADRETAWRTEVGAVARVGIAPGDRAGWAAGYDGTLFVFDLVDGAVTGRFAGAERAAVAAVAVSGDARMLAAARGTEVITWLRPTRPTRHLVARLSTSGQGLAVSADGARVAAGDDAGRVVLADLPSGLATADWALGSPVRALAFAPEGDKLAAITRDGGLAILSTAGAVHHTPARRPTAAAWTAAGLFVGGKDGSVSRIDPATGELGVPTPVVPGAIWHLEPLADGRLLVGSHGAPENPVRLFDPATGAVTESQPGGPSRYHSAVSADGRLGAAGQQDGRVPIWELATGTLLHTLHADDGPTLGVAFSPDGATLATTGFGGRVMLWDVATGTQLRSIDQHGALGTNLIFTPDGSTLLSVGDDVHIGALRLDRPAREAGARAALARGERTAAVFAALDWWERAR